MSGIYFVMSFLKFIFVILETFTSLRTFRHFRYTILLCFFCLTRFLLHKMKLNKTHSELRLVEIFQKNNIMPANVVVPEFELEVAVAAVQ